MKRFFNIFFVIAVIFSLQMQAFARDFRFVQIADLNFAGTKQDIQRVKRLVKSVNSTKSLDFVVFTGDNLVDADQKSLETLLKLTQHLNAPYYFEIGNSDCSKYSGLTKEKYAKMVSRYTGMEIKSFNYYVKCGDLVLIFLDGAKQLVQSESGYYSEDTIVWLDDTLKKFYNKKVIIFQQFPILSLGKNSNRNLEKPELYIDLLRRKRNILAIFSGHYHFDEETEINGVMHVIASPASGVKPSYKDVYVLNKGKSKYEIYTKTVNF